MAESLANILVVEDSGYYSGMLEDVFSAMGFETTCCADGEAALKEYAVGSYDLCLVDIHMEGMDGLAFLKALKEKHPRAIVIMMTGYPTVKLAVNAFKNGAFDFLGKPIDFKNLQLVIKSALETRNAETADEGTQSGLLYGSMVKKKGGGKDLRDIIIGEGKKTDDLITQIEKLARTSVPTLVQGETGTMKKAVAEYLHYNGEAKEGPIISIDIAECTEANLRAKLIGNESGIGGSSLAEARGGSLILHNIDRMPMAVQMEFNEIIQETAKHYRLICTIPCDLDEMLEKGEFSDELGFKLTMAPPILIPALRDSMDDFYLMVSHYTKGAFNPHYDTEDIQFSPPAMEMMRAYSWPGNHMELIEVITSVVSVTQTKKIGVTQLPYYMNSRLDYWPTLRSILAREENKYVNALIKATGHQYNRVAEILGVTREDVVNIKSGTARSFFMMNELDLSGATDDDDGDSEGEINVKDIDMDT